MSKDTMIDIAGLDKAAILSALWDASTPLDYTQTLDPSPEDFAELVAAKPEGVLAYYDVLWGHVIRVDLTDIAVQPKEEYDAKKKRWNPVTYLPPVELDPAAFDEHNGAGSAAAAIATLR